MYVSCMSYAGWKKEKKEDFLYVFHVYGGGEEKSQENIKLATEKCACVFYNFSFSTPPLNSLSLSLFLCTFYTLTFNILQHTRKGRNFSKKCEDFSKKCVLKKSGVYEVDFLIVIVLYLCL